MHAGLPNFCLGNYFRLLSPGAGLTPVDAESFLAWATAPGRELRLAGLMCPARRFLTEGGDYALDVVDRCLDLLDRLADPDPGSGRRPAPGAACRRGEARKPRSRAPAVAPGEGQPAQPRAGLGPGSPLIPTGWACRSSCRPSATRPTGWRPGG